MSENLRVSEGGAKREALGKKPLPAWLFMAVRPVVDLSESEGAEEASLPSRADMKHYGKISELSKVQLESERVRRRTQKLAPAIAYSEKFVVSLPALPSRSLQDVQNLVHTHMQQA